MTPSQIQLLQESIAIIEPVKAEVGRSFFARLFELSPRSRDSIGHDTEQRWLLLIGMFERLMNRQLRSMLTLPATSTQSPEAVTKEIVQVSHNYSDQGFRPDQMEHVERALLWALSRHLGDAFDAKTAEAWSQITGLVFHSMTRIMAKDAVAVSLPAEDGRAHHESSNPLDQIFERTMPEPAKID